jgi:hypothetical protein
VVQRHPQVVILGDPGSGKTTLVRWLVLQFARAMQQRMSHVHVDAGIVSLGAQQNTSLDLGPTRIPIFLRIADYARARWEKDQGDNNLLLERFLGGHENKRDLPPDLTPEVISAIIQTYLTQGKALVVLDGLDEVADPDQRKAVMQEVKRLLRSASPETTLVSDMWASNCVVLTSRIIGYQFDPLIDLPHYTVEGMDRKAITAFCHAWMHHVAATNNTETAEQANKLRDAIFGHAYPGVQVLASNPLLLTIMARVYCNSTQRMLPARRVELFEEAIHTLYKQRKAFWDRAGIPEGKLTRALGAVAAHIHANEVTGFLEEGEVRKQLGTVFTDPEQVEAVLCAARDVSGFLVARGEGVYGFLHRALQEYFTAHHLTARPDQVVEQLSTRLLDPTWREPIVLAVGVVSRPRYPESRRRLLEVFTSLLDAPDPVGDVLPRRELLAAAACTECERIPPGVGQRIAENLLAIRLECAEQGRSLVMRERIQHAFTTLHHSPAAAETEAVLCSVVQSPNIEHRYEAIELVLRTQEASPTLTSALVNAWRTFADPVEIILSGLEQMHVHHPNCFTADSLPMRRPDNAWIWERARESPAWQNLLRILYLPPYAEVVPECVNRDSPLTECIVDVLGQASGPDAQLLLQQRLLPLANQPGTAQYRDAALALCALGDASWIPIWVQAAREQEDFLYPLLDSLDFYFDHLWHISAHLDFYEFLDNIRDVYPDIYKRCFLAFYDISQALEKLKLFSSSGLTPQSFDSGLTPQVFARVRSRAHELISIVRTIYPGWPEDAPVVQQTVVQQISNPLPRVSFQMFLEEIDFFESLSTVCKVLITAIAEQWPDTPELPTDNSEPAATRITLHKLAMLVDDLVSLDDRQREHAHQVLKTKRQASALGRRFIDHLASLAEMHRSNPQIGPQLESALRTITHDRPGWVRAWIVQAGKTEEVTPALTILGTMGDVTPETFTTLIQTLPKTAPLVKEALLDSIVWQLDMKRIPQEHQTLLQERFLIWLDQETDPAARRTIIDVLGQPWCWEQKSYMAAAGTKLLDQLAYSVSEPERAAIYMTLASLAQRQPEIIEPVREALLKGGPHATRALAHLNVSEAIFTTIFEENLAYFWKAQEPFKQQATQAIATSLLTKLTETIPSPTSCLMTLLDAGTDDEPWHDIYHQIIAVAIRIQLERPPDHLQWLLKRLQQALEQKDWQTHRIMLAAVAACAEAMPTALQQAAQGKLESLLVRGTLDAKSYDSRRFALTALSYLGTVTSAVVAALLAGCQDDNEIVQQDAIEAASRFQSIEDDLLPTLVSALTGESAHTAYAVVQLLGRLGISAAGEAAGLRGQIIEALVNALKDPSSQREVMVAGESKGKLEDILYLVLLSLVHVAV